MQYLRSDIADAWQGLDSLTEAFALEGEVFREVAGVRRTLRVQIGDQFYFVKLHYGVGWREIWKNWVQLKRPIIGAENEYNACRDLAELGMTAPQPAAYAQDNGNIAKRRSFVLCDELADYQSLEDVTNAWFTPQRDNQSTLSVAPKVKLRLLKSVAKFAREFHAHGFVHRDFYICHLLIHDYDLQAMMAGPADAADNNSGVKCDSGHNSERKLAVLDLHRAQRFAQLPDKWRRRDLAALLFSTLDLGYSERDWLRFIRLYSGRSLRVELQQRGSFWRSVLLRAHKLYKEGLRKGTVKGLYEL